MDGKGKLLTGNQIKNALRRNRDNKGDDIHSLATELNLPIDSIAQNLIDLPSPTGTR